MFQLALEIGSDFADIFTVKAYDFSFGDPLHAPPLPALAEPEFDAEARQFLLVDPEGPRDDAGDPLARPGPGRRRLGRLSDRARAARAVGARRRHRALADWRGSASRPRGAPVRRGAPAHPRLADGLAAARAAAALRMGRPRARRLAVGGRPRRSQDSRQGERQPERRPAPGGRHAVVHDGVRPGLDHHGHPDVAARPGARPQRARGARRAPGDGRRPGDRRRAGEDRARGAPRQGDEIVVRALLRHRRRDAALPRPPLRGLALDGRREARQHAAGACPQGARVDRPLRRPRRGRVRRVREAKPARARQPVVEGLVRLAALPRRQDRAHADRARARCRATSSTRSSAWPRSRARSGATGRSPTGSTARRRSYGERSTTRTGSRSAVATTRSRSTATSSASTRCARTWATSCGAASSRRSARTRSSTS